MVDIAGAYELMRSGVVSGGMIPKVESCIEAVLFGVKKVFILDGRQPHSILVEMLSDEGAGTMVVEAKQ
jgi:acetylglutamate kinase